MTESLADPSTNKFTFLPKGAVERFVVLLPIINGIATLLTPHFLNSAITPGVIRAFIILLFSIPFIFKKFPGQFRVAKISMIFIVYLLLLTLLSSHFFTSINVVSKVIISSLHLFFGLYYARRPLFLKRLSISIIITIGLFLIDFILANIFGYGGSSYKGVENELNFGGNGVNMAKQMSGLILMMPVFFLQFKDKKTQRILLFISIFATIYILFAFKRSAVIGLVLGYLFIIYSLPNKGKVLKWIFTLFTLGLLLSPLYINQILDNVDARQEAILLNDQENLDRQGRYHEYLRVTEYWVEGSIKHKLIGSEIFNDPYFYKVRRMLHTDYMSLLSGAGIIGLGLYILIYFSIIRSLKRKKNYFQTVESKYFYSVGGALVIGMLFYAISGIVQAIEPRGTILLFIGALISTPLLRKKQINEVDK